MNESTILTNDNWREAVTWAALRLNIQISLAPVCAEIWLAYKAETDNLRVRCVNPTSRTPHHVVEVERPTPPATAPLACGQATLADLLEVLSGMVAP